MLYSNFILFVFMYLMSFHLVMSSDDWFLVWLGLEINMMMFIMIVYERYSVLNIESCMKYFFIQSMGSAILLSLFYFGKMYFKEVVCLVMSYKVGAGPFFFWFPSICGGISWLSCFILMCFQKIIPFILLSMFVSGLMFFVIMLSLAFGIMGSFNQNDLKQLIAFSSVYHLGWMMLSLMSSDEFWVIYLIMYSLLIFPMILFFKSKMMISLMDVVSMKYKKWFVMMMLSMAGMPPLLGFFLKWFAFITIFLKSYFFWLILMMSSVVMFYVYYRVIYDVLMGFFMNGVWTNWMEKSNEVWWDLVTIFGMVMGGSVIMLFC
uniref:NADH-ubiquinone oxidoreductase chain 2 n=1 Tax=Oxyopes sertatus TaxID=93706 RepID=A0A0U1XBH4_OXYSE|nr:NADH dehydrogenase subunit 2 [Oxyopes sertatus]AIP86893.1 NADH dehydrogenase subunit 2 [Oxyopes sertatus]